MTQADALGREVTVEIGSGANRLYEVWGYDRATGRIEVHRDGHALGLVTISSQ